ncbi:aldo-keto reductase family 1 member D1 isoform X2 [Tachyglossus aculeatus]|uniref:aldo-keto reductase family 1 member D1 isoform X2 n=1 Tax=Tachyglossus aculeatus TaxID=9261 RepID=UPI0018F40110|nr:aldo-keto reductase family 1 member D1 isoform X2 [Tachyglossus aculeatus]
MNLTATRHHLKLSDGNFIPVIGLGTYSSPKQTPKGTCAQAVKVAIDAGYRHFDGALVYYNEHEVGQAIRDKIREGVVKREDIFYCGKLWNTYQQPELVRRALEKTLKCLQSDYVDLYVIETPMTFKALEACKDAGLVRSLGVSNFNRRQLELILNKPGLKHKPVVNQVEYHPYFTQPKLLEFCRSHGIILVGYSPLGTSRDKSWVSLSSPPLLEDPLLMSISRKYGKTVAQVVLRFSVQKGVVVIPKSFSEARIRENFQIFDFSLTDEEMEAIEALNKGVRYVDMLFWSDHPEYPFHDEY